MPFLIEMKNGKVIEAQIKSKYAKEAEFRSFFNKDKFADKEKIIYKLFKDI